MDDVWVTQKEAARIVGVTAATVSNWCTSGRVKRTVSKSGRTARVELRSVAAYKASSVAQRGYWFSNGLKFRKVNIDGGITSISLLSIGAEYGDIAVVEHLKDEIRIRIRKDDATPPPPHGADPTR